MKTKKDKKTKFNKNSAKEIFEKSKDEIKKFLKVIKYLKNLKLKNQKLGKKVELLPYYWRFSCTL